MYHQSQVSLLSNSFFVSTNTEGLYSTQIPLDFCADDLLCHATVLDSM